jgi:hypothetical protein
MAHTKMAECYRGWPASTGTMALLLLLLLLLLAQLLALTSAAAAGAAGAASLLLLDVTVINCTGPDSDGFIKPFAGYVDPASGEPAAAGRVQIPTEGQHNLTGLGSNFALASRGGGAAAAAAAPVALFATADDQPPGYPQGIRTVLASASIGGGEGGGSTISGKHRIVPMNVTDIVGWNPLDARWLIAIGPDKLLARHRSISIDPSSGGAGGGDGSTNEWLETIDTSQPTAPPDKIWRSKVVYNRTTAWAVGEPLPAPYFGEEWYGKRLFGAMFVQTTIYVDYAIGLPKQARDKNRENSNQRRFVQGLLG